MTLYDIKEYIVNEMSNLNPSMRLNLDIFLQRLIEKEEGSIIKDKYQIKAGQQLLCCIGIDLKHGNLPKNNLLNIFNNVAFDEWTKEARILFEDAKKSPFLHHLSCEEAFTTEYRIMVFPIKDWKRYIDSKILGITDDNDYKGIGEALSKYLKRKSITVKDAVFDKNGWGYFWVTPPLIDIKTTAEIVDRLGLSHFDFVSSQTNFFFYVLLQQCSCKSCKPNASIVNWYDPRVGFLSYRPDIAGRTFPVSGYPSLGLKERTFKTLKLTEDQQKESFVRIFSSPLVDPINLNTEDIIQEGIKRFYSM